MAQLVLFSPEELKIYVPEVDSGKNRAGKK